MGLRWAEPGYRELRGGGISAREMETPQLGCGELRKSEGFLPSVEMTELRRAAQEKARGISRFARNDGILARGRGGNSDGNTGTEIGEEKKGATPPVFWKCGF
jgi:hypothetical protein